MRAGRRLGGVLDMRSLVFVWQYFVVVRFDAKWDDPYANSFVASPPNCAAMHPALSDPWSCSKVDPADS